MKLLKTTLLLVLIPFLSTAQWNQIGDPINGLEANERSGITTSINASGFIMAIGAPNNDTNGNAAGQARVFEWDGTNWNQRGSFINGTAANDNFGQNVSLNAAGDVLLVGAPGFSSSNPAIEGYARVFEWNGTDWIQRGMDLIGDAMDDSYGATININADGTIVAISGEPFVGIGYVQIFEWDGTNWNQRGETITSEIPGNGFGRSIQMDAAGNAIIIGETGHDGDENDQGLVKIFEWNGTNWDQKGSDLLGDNEADFFGTGVTINTNGTIIAAGAREAIPTSNGYVKVFEWDGTDWEQIGVNLLGNDSSGDFFGDVNDLNGEGNLIISGTVLGEYARISQFNGTDWEILQTIEGSAPGGQFGTSVAINNSGSVVCVGASQNDAGGAQAGQVLIFENETLNVTDFSTSSIHLVPNPVTDTFTITTLLDVEEIIVYSILGQKLQAFTINNNQVTIDLSNQPSGTYLVSIRSKTNVQTARVIKK